MLKVMWAVALLSLIFVSVWDAVYLYRMARSSPHGIMRLARWVDHDKYTWFYKPRTRPPMRRQEWRWWKFYIKEHKTWWIVMTIILAWGGYLAWR